MASIHLIRSNFFPRYHGHVESSRAKAFEGLKSKAKN